MHYLLRRVANALFLLGGVSLLSFLFLQLAPGDYFDSLRTNPRVSPETVEALRTQSGAARPFVARYGHWLLSIARGDWGYSLAYNTPAASILMPRAANTLLLTISATLLAWIAALFFGIVGASLRATPLDPVFKSILAVLFSVPDVLVALLLLLWAVRSGSLPAGGITSQSFSSSFVSSLADIATHAYLPVVCLALSSLPVLTAHVRSGVSEALDLPFVRAARGYGIPESRILLRHVLPVAANPLLSLWGLSIGGLLSSSLIVEIVFSWPGLGNLLLDSILQRDLYVVADVAMLSSLFLVTGNLLADVLIYFVDPRIRVT